MSSQWLPKTPDCLKETIRLRYSSFEQMENHNEQQRLHKQKKFHNNSFAKKHQSETRVTFTKLVLPIIRNPCQSQLDYQKELLMKLRNNFTSSNCDIQDNSLKQLRQMTNHKSMEQIHQSLSTSKRSWLIKTKSNQLKILFFNIYGQLCIAKQKFLQAIDNFMCSEYYSRKQDVHRYTIWCLVEQSEIWTSLAEFQSALGCLQKALHLSIFLQRRELEQKMLEKIGIVYYLLGNIELSEYYHRMAEKGIPHYEREAYLQQYDAKLQIAKLDSKLFHLPVPSNMIQLNKNNQINSNIGSTVEERLENNSVIINKMIKQSNFIRIGRVMKQHVKNTNTLASIRITQTSKSPQHGKNAFFKSFIIQNQAHVIKSHLSKNRVTLKRNRDLKFQRMLALINNKFDIGR